MSQQWPLQAMPSFTTMASAGDTKCHNNGHCWRCQVSQQWPLQAMPSVTTMATVGDTKCHNNGHCWRCQVSQQWPLQAMPSVTTMAKCHNLAMNSLTPWSLKAQLCAECVLCAQMRSKMHAVRANVCCAPKCVLCAQMRAKTCAVRQMRAVRSNAC